MARIQGVDLGRVRSRRGEHAHQLTRGNRLLGRKLDWPRLDTYDCKSAGYSNNETCTLYYPTPGTYYIKLYGTSESSGAQLIATMDRPYTAPVLVRGQPYVGVSLGAGEQRRYEIDLPWGKSDLKFGVVSAARCRT